MRRDPLHPSQEKEKALPFEPLISNATTIAAMKEARRGGLASFDSIDALMADLDEEHRAAEHRGVSKGLSGRSKTLAEAPAHALGGSGD